VPPRELEPSLSPELEAVVLRALAKEPADRYPSMSALLLELETALPVGSDRLLIEAQSGTSLAVTPFPGTLSPIARPDSERMPRASQPMPILGSQPPPVGSQSMPTVGARPSAVSVAPPRRRRGLAIAAGLVGVASAVAAVVLWMDRARTAAPEVTTTTTEPRAPAKLAAAAAPEDREPTDPPKPAPTDPPKPEPTDPPNAEPAPAPVPAVAPAPVPSAKAPGRRVPGTRPRVVRRPTPPARAAKAGTQLAEVAPPPDAQIEVATVAPPEPPPAEPPPAPPPSAPHETEPAKPIAPPAPPAPVRPAPPPAVDPGSLDAAPEIASLDVRGSLPSSVVRRGIERALPALRACYRSAAKARGATPLLDMSLSFEIDENSSTLNAAARGGTLPGLPGCATGAASRIRVQQAPDVGTVQVTVAIRFRPT
jgi:hypothetical protein